MSFLNHPSLQRLIKDREKAKKLWKAPTETQVIEEVTVSKPKEPKKAFQSFEERMVRALIAHGSLQLRVSFDLLESVQGKTTRHYFYVPIPEGKMRVKLENQGRLLKLIEEIKKLGIDFVRK